MKHYTVAQLQRISHDLQQEIDDLEYFGRRVPDTLIRDLNNVRDELSRRSGIEISVEYSDADVEFIESAMQSIASDAKLLEGLISEAYRSGDTRSQRRYAESLDDHRRSFEILEKLKKSLTSVRQTLQTLREKEHRLEGEYRLKLAQYQEEDRKLFDRREAILEAHKHAADVLFVRLQEVRQELITVVREEEEVTQTIRRQLNIQEVRAEPYRETYTEPVSLVDSVIETIVSDRSELDLLREELAQAIAEGEPKNIIRKIQKRIEELS